MHGLIHIHYLQWGTLETTLTVIGNGLCGRIQLLDETVWFSIRTNTPMNVMKLWNITICTPFKMTLCYASYPLQRGWGSTYIHYLQSQPNLNKACISCVVSFNFPLMWSKVFCFCFFIEDKVKFRSQSKLPRHCLASRIIAEYSQGLRNIVEK